MSGTWSRIGDGLVAYDGSFTESPYDLTRGGLRLSLTYSGALDSSHWFCVAALAEDGSCLRQYVVSTVPADAGTHRLVFTCTRDGGLVSIDGVQRSDFTAAGTELVPDARGGQIAASYSAARSASKAKIGYIYLARPEVARDTLKLEAVSLTQLPP
jgi:hypothetical protein